MVACSGAAWLAGQGLASGFRPWEKLILLAAYVLPIAARGLAMKAELPLAPLLLAALFTLILRRAGAPSAAAATDRPSHASGLTPEPSAS